MNTQLSQEDYKNILALIGRANITGQEAMATAVLQQKLSGMLQEEPIKSVKEEEKSEPKE